MGQGAAQLRLQSDLKSISQEPPEGTRSPVISQTFQRLNIREKPGRQSDDTCCLQAVQLVPLLTTISSYGLPRSLVPTVRVNMCSKPAAVWFSRQLTKSHVSAHVSNCSFCIDEVYL